MSVVKFLCPQGHPLTAPLNLVGKTGKCPKCSASFVVPPPESNDALAGGSKSSPSGRNANGTDSSPQLNINLGSGIKEGPGAKAPQDIFVFLCPNGHKLNGPPSLKGKLGQCPHCGARFRIPEDEPTSEPEAEEIGGAELVDEPPPGTDVVEEYSQFEQEPPFEEGVHPLAHIMNRLWYYKVEAGEIEILLPEGEIMHPEHYSAVLSSQGYGVFATREGMGFSFSVIPWANVRRVNLHKVDDLPAGVFPE